MDLIPIFKPSLGDAELEALREIFKSGWIGLGPKVGEFEERFAEYVENKHAVAVSSATAALHLACLCLGIGEGDEVLVPTISFVSTAHAVRYCGGKVVFVDVDEETLCIDVEDARRKVTGKTKAIISVHYGGHACDMLAVWRLAKEKNLYVIEDAAHACGASYMGKKIGGQELTDMTCFSFHAVKNLAIGDGGMITFGEKWADKVEELRQLRWCGIDKSTWERGEKKYGWSYEVPRLGYKCHMNDIAAVIGIEQLKKLDYGNRVRREIARIYSRVFEKFPWIEVPVERWFDRSSWHNYCIKLDKRDQLNEHLKERNISSGVHYKPLHLHEYYQGLGNVSLPVAERVWKRLLLLPLYPSMKWEEIDRVIEGVSSFGGS